MNTFTSPLDEVFFTKNDPRDPRWGEVFQFVESAPSGKHVALLGYPDDDGIIKNGGRPGAKEGPDAIRKWLYRMAPTTSKDMSFFDLGNLENFEKSSLEKRHESCQEKLQKSLSQGGRGLTLGGGHDYGYPDGSAFLESIENKNTRPLLLNFDAHLDVRDLQYGVTSGTPFFRLREKYKNFDMIQVGIQTQCNSKHHLEWCKENNIEILLLKDFFGKPMSLLEIFKQMFSSHITAGRPTYISMDIDGFSSSYAPGCSQSWPTGIEPRDFFPLYNWLLSTLDVRLLSIYEVSPPLDLQFMTAKLAAQIAHHFLEVQCLKN